MEIQKEETSPRQVTLTITLTPEELESYKQRAYRRVVKRVSIPGFRRGKAPRAVLENYVGTATILQEAVEMAVPEVVQKALEQEGIEPFAEPDVDVTEIEPLTLKVVVALEPEVDLGDYQAIRLEKSPAEVSDEEVQRELDQLREQLATWEPVDRPVQFEDLLTIDVWGEADGEEIANLQGIEYIPREDSPVPLPGFAEQLVGLNKGDEKEFTLEVPQDFENTALAGKTARFRVKVTEVKEKRLPDLNDEFAQSVGQGYDTLDQLKEEIARRLREQKEQEETRRLRQEAFEEAVKRARVEIPPLLVEREVDALLQERVRAVQQADPRMDLDTYLQTVNKSQEELREELRPEAEERITRFMVLRKLAEAEGIEVSEQDVDTEIEEMASGQQGQGADLVRALFSNPRGRSTLASGILRRRVLERLEQIATADAGDGESGPQEPASQEGPTAEEETEGGREDAPTSP